VNVISGVRLAVIQRDILVIASQVDENVGQA
jgi:hypothetical protein